MGKILIVHPTGNEFFRAAVNGFYKAGCLHSIYTSVASFPNTLLYGLGSFKIFTDIRRRTLNEKLKCITHVHPWKETARLLAIKTGNKSLAQHETGVFSVDAVYKSLDKHVAKKLAGEVQRGVSAVYAYEDGAYNSFAKAGKLGMQCLYDLPIGYWRSMHAILGAEKGLNPNWGVTLEGLKDSKQKLERKDEELRLANAVFVASSFTAKTLEKYPDKLSRVHVIPYGFPAINSKAYHYNTGSKKMKLLFVGGLSQRKGLSYLFKAVEGLEAYIELTVVGRLPKITCELLNRELRKHTYINSIPHEEVLELMRQHDVLVFPSLFEGFGQVITEAMAQGTPVITTERTAGPDIIKHGENGWLVKAGSAEEIKNVIEEILSNRGIIEQVGTKALETAKKRPWSVYGQELAEAVMKLKVDN